MSIRKRSINASRMWLNDCNRLARLRMLSGRCGIVLRRPKPPSKMHRISRMFAVLSTRLPQNRGNSMEPRTLPVSRTLPVRRGNFQKRPMTSQMTSPVKLAVSKASRRWLSGSPGSSRMRGRMPWRPQRWVPMAIEKRPPCASAWRRVLESRRWPLHRHNRVSMLSAEKLQMMPSAAMKMPPLHWRG